MANLPIARGRLITAGGRATLAARCPFCGHEHRYDKGDAADPEVALLQEQGFSEEWLPCQFDLPGNFWRITFGTSRRRRGGGGGDGRPRSPGGRSPGRGPSGGPQGVAPGRSAPPGREPEAGARSA